MEKRSPVFQPLKIGKLTARNRIEMAPAAAGLNDRMSVLNQRFVEHNKSFALGGAAIVTVGITTTDELMRKRNLSAGFADSVNDFVEIAEVIKSCGAIANIELGLSKTNGIPPEKLANETSPAEMREMYRLYADAADRLQRAGFDMIMVHGGHGNLPARFFSPLYNHRGDEYGGSVANRGRFALELLDAIRQRVGNKIAIEYRLSGEELEPGGAELEETLEFAKLIEDRIDLLHISRGILEIESHLPYLFQPTYFPRAMNLPTARAFKKIMNIPVSVVGSFDMELAEKAIAAGDVDMVAMIRNLFADPACVKKAYAGKDEEIRPCVRCNSCINRTHSFSMPVRCAVNARLGKETRFTGVMPLNQKIVLVGGGPANLEAARAASSRGCEVVLFEKQNRLGGMLNYASMAPFKADMRKYLDWSIRTVVNDPKIEVRLGVEATPELVEAEKPYAAVIAVGAKPILPKLPTTCSKAVWVGDIEEGMVEAGDTVVIAGAGFTGLEAALALAQKGKKVTVIDLLPEDRIGSDGIAISMIGLRELLRKADVKFICEVRLVDVTDEGAVISDKDGQIRTLPCDTVALSLGVRADKETAEKFRYVCDNVYFIGDCGDRGGKLYDAVHAGFDTIMWM